jgi:SsrA-binding protein
MIVGVLKEIKAQENRVCMTPAGVEVRKQHGHTVLVEQSAGVGSGFADSDYTAAGAQLVATPAEVYAQSDMVMHVKEPQASEYAMVRPGQIVFTYFHFAADEKLTREFMKTGSVAIAYETVTGPQGGLPLLTPMSEVAGRMAANYRMQQGQQYIRTYAAAFARAEKDGLYLYGLHIAPYAYNTLKEIDPLRTRKLLLHGTEIVRINNAVDRKGYAIVPLAMYWKNNRVKVEIGLGKGKQLHDKRDTEKARDWGREKDRIMKRH